jgi:hypothetical protein
VARLPIDAGDTNVWGQLLNEFLLVSHNADGTTKVVPSHLGLPMASGEIPYDRRILVETAAATSGDVVLSYFVASKTETINAVAMYSGGTAAATVTLCRFGVYLVAGNGDLSLIHATANDATVFAGLHTRYQRSLTVPWAKTAGTTYAVGHLVVATTMPTVYGATAGPAAPFDAIFAREPRVSGVRIGQTDLPASIAAADVIGNRRNPFFEVLN